ncbi:hypothetical protein HORIV_44910 [Vreelandella olivaria]|uniref:Thioredoxin-like fold domain-containing protein n=1 Tax=Vreelandella olivaria TaxID=390919 RepID=A0ABM9SCV3_9GAMM|nr:hypothetical protein HORIV_44910 [Halomonas olivaria]
MAIFNPNVRHVAIDGALFQDEVESREIMSVPSIYLNGKPFDQGRMTLEQILAKVDTGAAERDAKKLSEKPLSIRSSLVVARQALRRPFTQRVRVLIPALPPSASVGRWLIPWGSKTLSLFPIPKAPSW